jgi:hypothetical protein
MKRTGWLLVGAVVVVVGLAYWYMRGSSETTAVSFIQQMSSAKLQPRPEAFTSKDSEIAGVRKPSIVVSEPGRITYHLTVPQNGFLKTSVGLLEPSWTMKGDGVLFYIGISDGQTYEDLFRMVINPFGDPSQRHWFDVSSDLSAYAGKTVDIIFNTRPSPPPEPGSGQPQLDDRNGDMPVWGDPRIIIR